MSRASIASLLLAIIGNATLAGHSAAESAGALSNPTGRPIGGGEGYGDWANAQAQPVSTAAELVDQLATATDGTIVYVDDDAVIELDDHWNIEIPPGVTLASGRGRNGSLGALLYTNTRAKRNLFHVDGPGSRITGLRLRGPDTNIDPGNCGGDDATAIRIDGVAGSSTSIAVDNNEMWGWPHGPVWVSDTNGAYVHHNHIHHNRREMNRPECGHGYGLGYGIRVDVGDALIEANLFDHNRHDIASNGEPGAIYEARYNLVLNGAVQHSFDVHGGEDRGDDTDIAGSWFNVHHNTFLQSGKPAFNIRGVPLLGAAVWSNEFLHGSEAAAVRQESKGKKIDVWVNLSTSSNLLAVDHFPAWFVSFGGTSFWRWRRFDALRMSKVRFADFDGDGSSDALTTPKGEWLISRGARLPWQHLTTSAVPLGRLRFGDFDGDGRDDVFRAHRGEWQVSWGGTSAWTRLNYSRVRLHSLAFGDFDGDGRTDVFHADGKRWYVSWSGTSPWSEVNTSALKTTVLRFADFNGDGRDDVFRSDGADWYVSFGGTGPWSWLNSSRVSLRSLAFGDFDGDGHDDVFYANGRTWSVSWRGAMPWEQINASSFATRSLAFADVNGDGRTDVLSRQF
jgi:hypothetical protein